MAAGRRRSITMFDTLVSQKVLSKEGDQNSLKINEKPYRIVTGAMTDFLSEQYVSIGGDGLGRELIAVDPQSEELNKVYKKLRDEILDSPEFKEFKAGDHLTPERINTVFETIYSHVRTIFDFGVEDTKKLNTIFEAKLDAICSEWKGDYVKGEAEINGEVREIGSPVISLDFFIKNKMGVCRHHVLLVAFFVSSLIRDGLLPKGEVHIHRNFVQSGDMHSWVIYIPESKQGQDGYSIDTMIASSTLPFSIIDQMGSVEGLLYREGEVTEVIDRFLPLLHFSQITDEKSQNEFIIKLLRAPPEYDTTKETILDCQKLADLTLIYRALKQNKDKFKQEKYKPYPEAEGIETYDKLLEKVSMRLKDAEKKETQVEEVKGEKKAAPAAGAAEVVEEKSKGEIKYDPKTMIINIFSDEAYLKSKGVLSTPEGFSRMIDDVSFHLAMVNTPPMNLEFEKSPAELDEDLFKSLKRRAQARQGENEKGLLYKLFKKDFRDPLVNKVYAMFLNASSFEELKGNLSLEELRQDWLKFKAEHPSSKVTKKP